MHIEEGPLAILPCKKNSFSVVWSMNNQTSDFDDEEEKFQSYIKSKLQTVHLTTKKLKFRRECNPTL